MMFKCMYCGRDNPSFNCRCEGTIVFKKREEERRIKRLNKKTNKVERRSEKNAIN